MKWLQRAALALCLMLLPAWGLAASGMELEAEMGYDGNATYVRRLPVTVRLTNHGGDADGKVVVDVNRSETQFDRYELEYGDRLLMLHEGRIILDRAGDEKTRLGLDGSRGAHPAAEGV